MPIWKQNKELQRYTAHNLQTVKDYNGFVFFGATDQFLSIVFSQILQMPEINAVYIRESQSKMYSPSAYFLAKWSVSTAIYSF